MAMTVQHPKPASLIPFLGSLMRSLNNMCETVEIATEGLRDGAQGASDISRMALQLQADRLRAELTHVRPALT